MVLEIKSVLKNKVSAVIFFILLVLNMVQVQIIWDMSMMWNRI